MCENEQEVSVEDQEVQQSEETTVESDTSSEGVESFSGNNQGDPPKDPD